MGTSCLLTNTERDFLPAAQICPEEMVLFLQSQLGGEREAGCVAALDLLSALACSDGQYHGTSLLPFGLCLYSCFCASLAEPVMTEKLPQVAEAVQCLCSDLRIRVSWFGKGKDCWGGDAAANMGRAGVTREVLGHRPHGPDGSRGESRQWSWQAPVLCMERAQPGAKAWPSPRVPKASSLPLLFLLMAKGLP